jgi:hypothetical protein
MKTHRLALATFAVCLLTASASAQAVIDFPKGSGTATREAVLNKGVLAWDYQLRAKPGQTVTIKLAPSPARAASFELFYEGEGDHPVSLASKAASWTGRLPATGLEDRRGVATYNISVSPRVRRVRGEVRFRLAVTVR